MAPPLDKENIMDVDNVSDKTSAAHKLTFELPWIEKYRPKNLSDLVSHDEITNTIQRLIDANRLPHLLFYGPPGTGKTSTILAVARQLYGDNYSSMVLELNASDDRGIDTVRNQVQNFAGTRKLFSSGMKLIVLDEADNMTRDAQNALRRIVEKYAKNARFCLICNYVSKIIPALQSRCTRFRFSPLESSQVIARVRDVIEAEQVNVTEGGLNAVLNLGAGDMRKILNILQSTSLAHDEVTETAVHECTGKPTGADIKACVDSLMNQSFKDGYHQMRRLQVERGIALFDMLQGIYKYVTTLGLPKRIHCYLLERMAEVEHNLAFATNEKIQLGGLIGAFHVARKMFEEASMDMS